MPTRQISPDWEAVVNAIEDPVFVHDVEYRLVGANSAYLEQANLSREQALGRPYWEVFPQRNGPLPSCQEAMAEQDSLATKQERLDCGLHSTDRIKNHQNGRVFLSRAYPLADQQGNYNYSVHVLDDITERENARHSLQERDWQFQQLLANTSEGIIITDSEGIIIYANAAAGEFFGNSASALIGETFASETGKVQPQQIELQTPGSGTRTVEIRGRAIEWEGKKAWMTNLHDVTNRESLRLLFQDRISQALRALPSEQNKLAVLLIDINDFKSINDSFGQLVGDLALRQVADRLTRVKSPLGLAPIDYIASRLGGDEFGVLIPHIQDVGDLSAITEQFARAVETPITVDDNELHVSVRIGVSVYPNTASSAAELMQQADTAMYQAKREQSRHRTFSEDLTVEARERLELGGHLRQALANSELHLEYQLQVDMQSGCWVGSEALLRWNHPQRGRISPGHFIPIAERIGLIDQLGQWVLEQACQQAHAWRCAGLDMASISVNISAPQMTRGDLPEQVERALEKSGLPASALKLEITESILMEQDSWVVDQLQRLRAQGVKVSLDDFGTGYSSLSYLKDLPVDQLKIDRSFINGLDTDQQLLKINRVIINLASSLGFSLIAEGIETEEQARILLAEGCRYGQGFFYARPCPTHDIEKMLKELLHATHSRT
ncbi:diguanylate cyclase/phosphodiesterase with PAS/PAC sensor [Halorhodospira halochloris]|uniref:cyclic-guanylate-specific phosphodiesterase n=1 Tax=Halorhodospira halochloris TaxID=1052 RepID=A0A0X8XA65_HALHR|nr:EAL domain-containing protein [Halorhodospira halochloris]BAU58327.2 diguanylate cyclase/phosphodiesterase with PAS/PAC sensor [Halorhodospira halochloris]